MNVQQALAEVLPSESLAFEDDPGGGTGCVRPGSVEEVATVMAWATRESVGVLPTGSIGRPAGTAGLGLVAADGRPWITLSTERLSAVAIYEPADLTITVGAGAAWHGVAAALRENGQWLPFDPPLIEQRTVGGLVANGVSGPLWMGYGALCHHVLGATVVTGDGRTLALGGRVVKNVAGYDLLKPLVGSRGTLGVITSVCLRAFPLPLVDRVLVLRGDDIRELADVALRVASAPVLPVSSVLVDGLEIGGGDHGPPGAAANRAALVVRLHGAEATVDADRETLERHTGVPFADVLGGGPGVDADRGADSDGRFATLLGAVRDRASAQDVVLDASVKLSGLAAALDAMLDLHPEELVADGYAGRIRAGVAQIDGEAFESARAAIEDLGGAVRIHGGHGIKTAGDRGTELRPLESTLASRLRVTFDPGAVLWPARKRSTT